MLRRIIQATVIAVLMTGSARAQVLPGDSPNSGIGAAVANSPASVRNVLRLHSSEGSWPDNEGEQRYRETLKKIPNRKPSSDPWRTIRQTPTASSPDRHRAE